MTRPGLRRAIWLLGLALPGCLLDPYANLTEVRSDSIPTAVTCGECHGAIYEEFRVSAHAEAWTRPAFVDATSGHRFEDCLGCHAPESIYVTGTPVARTGFREEGVTCVSCHFDGQVMAGPAPSSALLHPHPIAEQRDLYLRSDLCGRCHEGTFDEWKKGRAPDDDRTCQDCHMARVDRTLTQATGPLSRVLVAFEESYNGRKHTFHVGAVAGLEDTFTVRGQPRLEAVQLTSLVPHQVPTGDFGFRRIRVVLEGVDKTGAVVATSTTELFKELGQALQPRQPRTFRAVFPPEAVQARLRLLAGKRSGPEVLVHEAQWNLE